MSETKTIHVPHLGGVDAGYQLAQPYDASKPTVILVNSFTTSSELYRAQFQNEELTEKMNLIAIELLGHGQTRTKTEHWTYWDTAIMNLQVLDALGIKGKVFVLGTSQGGWICVRMALLAPEKIAGILPLGTSMDYESPRSRSLGCWDALDSLAATIAGWTSPTATPDFSPTDEYCEFLLQSGFGGLDHDPEAKSFWISHVKANYQGDEGRKRARMCAINLRDRDGLHSRLGDVKCPVWWMHGTSDQVYSVRNAEEEIEMFTGVKKEDRRLVVVEGGQHFLSASHPGEVDEVLLEMVGRYGREV